MSLARVTSEPAPHWPALDGLRGVAVAAVISYHAFPKISANGYAGVDVFFVLSGFLITCLLLRERDSNGRISLVSFYARRALRLYPALLVTAALVFVLALGRGDVEAALPGVASALFYVSHITAGLGVSLGLLAHTWTLSLEEHYYFFWPAVLMLWMRGGGARVVSAVGLTALASIVVPGVLPGGIGSMYWRALPMLVGSALALLFRYCPRIFNGRAWGPLAAFAFIALSVVVLAPVDIRSTLMQGPFGVPSLLSVLVIVGFVTRSVPWTSRLLSTGALVWTGRRAYGLYLYHFPILLYPVVPAILSRIGVDLPLTVDLLLGIFLTFSIAWASYRWLELPFLRLKSRFRGSVRVSSPP